MTARSPATAARISARRQRRTAGAIVFSLAGAFALALAKEPPKLPAFGEKRKTHWVNSAPLTLRDLAGSVVLLEVWTFGCVNCVRSLDWVREVERRYAERGLVVVGVHSPEFDFEKDLDRLRDFVESREIAYPNLVDNDFRYWNKLGNRYWPTFYLVDRRGRIRHVHVGETHCDTERAREVEGKIEELLSEGDPR